MSYRVERFEPTPNPNAIKAILDRSPGSTPRAYRTPAAAVGDPLAESLFRINGITNLLIHDGWIAVGKEAQTPWAPIKRSVRAALRSVEDRPDG